MADPLESLVEALTARERENLALNPWFSIAQNTAQMPGYNPQSSDATNIGAGFIKGFLGNYAGNRAMGDYKRGLGSNLKIANQYLSAAPEEREAIIAANPELGEEAFYLRAYGEQEKRKEREKDQQLQNQFALGQSKAIFENPDSADMIGRIKLVKGPDGSMQVVREQEEPIGEPIANGSTVPPMSQSDLILPKKPFDLMLERQQRARKAGASKAGATSIAGAELKENMNRDDRIAKELEEADVRIGNLSQLLDEGERYVNAAGDTGDSIPGEQFLREQKVRFTDPQRFAAMKNLDTLSAQIISAARIPGTGSVSDYEAKMYLRSGLSTSNPKTANTEIIDRGRRLVEKLNQEREFMQVWRQQRETYDGAKEALAKYRKENPMFSRNGQNIELNDSRVNPVDWLHQKLGVTESQPVRGGNPGAVIDDMQAYEDQVYQEEMAKLKAGAR